MKQYLIALALIAAVSPIAQASKISVPNTAVVLYREADLPYGKHCGGGNEASTRKALNVNAAKWHVENNVDLKCKAIYRVFSSTARRPNWCAMVTLTEYCESRDLQQQQIASLYKACQQSPSEQCYRPDFIQYLKAFEQTKYFDVN